MPSVVADTHSTLLILFFSSQKCTRTWVFFNAMAWLTFEGDFVHAAIPTSLGRNARQLRNAAQVEQKLLSLRDLRFKLTFRNHQHHLSP